MGAAALRARWEMDALPIRAMAPTGQEEEECEEEEEWMHVN